MRFYYVALVFTAALLSATGAQPLTTEQNQVPALIDPKAARFDGVINRSLRTADTTDEDDEERAVLDKVTEAVHRLRFKVALKRAKTPEAKDLVQFAEWVRQKKNLDDVAKILGLSNTITGKGAAYNKYKAFESFWLKHRRGNNIGINFHVTPKNP